MKFFLVIIFISVIYVKSYVSTYTVKNSRFSKKFNAKNDTISDIKKDWEPIRLHFDFSHVDVEKYKKDYNDINDKIVPHVKSILEKLLKVRPRNRKMKLKEKCTEDITTPDHYITNGIDSDLVIFILLDTSGDYEKNNIQAAAEHCVQDFVTKRPVAGTITFRPDIDINDDTKLNYLTWLTLHELTHVLVFNEPLYEDYVDENFNNIGVDNVLGEKTLKNGKKATYIKTPKVLEKGKAHYNCDKFEGAILEYNGDSGNTGAHWSKKYMNTDYMIGNAYGEAVISDITLALFEDSGWYKVNYNHANLFLWGRAKGCEFLDDNVNCVNKIDDNNKSMNGKIVSTKFTDEFCTNINYPTCSISGVFRGKCVAKRYPEEIDEKIRLFADSHLGSPDKFTDMCPIALELYTGIKKFGGSCREGINKDMKSFEKICHNCACFMGHLTKKKNLKRSENDWFNVLQADGFNIFRFKELLPNRYNFLDDDEIEIKEDDDVTLCLEYKCNDGGLFIIIEKKEYQCIDGKVNSIDGYNGSITCPDNNILCHEKYKCKFGCLD